MNLPSAIETLLEVRPIADGTDSDPDVFVDQNRPLEGSGRVFGGITLGQSLNAAQQTVSPDFVAHSMHCTFVSARRAATVTEYHVERVKDGRQFCIRSVCAVQGRRTVFLAVVSFSINSSRVYFGGHMAHLEHALRFPLVPPPPAEYDDRRDSSAKQTSPPSPLFPFLNHSVGIRSSSSDEPARIHQWIRAREPISFNGGHGAHLAALACMSDSYFLAVAPHSHGIWDFDHPPLSEVYDGRHRLEMPLATGHRPIPRPHLQFPSGPSGSSPSRDGRRVMAMASLDHSLYFHDPARLPADQWLLAEIHSSWAGGGRAVVHQTIWGIDGTLVASCTQEGLVSVGEGTERTSRL